MTWQDYSRKWRNHLQAYFDLSDEQNISEISIHGRADHHRKSERYFLSKKATLYGVENHESFFLVFRPVLSVVHLKAEVEILQPAILEMVEISEEHMSSDVTICYFVEHITEDLRLFVQNYRYRKVFKLGWLGRLHVGLTVADTTGQTVYSKDRRTKNYRFLSSEE